MIAAASMFAGLECGRGDAGAPASDPRADGGSLLAITTPADGDTTVLRRLGRETLEPRGAGTDLGEYHGAWAFSPDGATLAVGTFVRTGVRLVDPVSLRILRDIPTPIAVTGVAWVGPTRIAALLQSGGVSVIDARSGDIERRWPLSYRLPCGDRHQAVTEHGAVFVVVGRGGAVRLLRVDAVGSLRVLELPRVRAPSTAHTCARPALAVDAGADRAVVVAARGPLAEVDLASMTATHHPASGLRRVLGSCRRRGRPCTTALSSLWPEPGTLVVGGVHSAGRGSRARPSPARVARIETATWRARRLGRAAGHVTDGAGGGILTYGGRRGIRSVTLAGATRWTALPRVRAWSVTAAAGNVYVLDEPPTRVRALDVRSGGRVGQRRVRLARLQILNGRTDAGDVN